MRSLFGGFYGAVPSHQAGRDFNRQPLTGRSGFEIAPAFFMRRLYVALLDQRPGLIFTTRKPLSLPRLDHQRVTVEVVHNDPAWLAAQTIHERGQP